jgi:cell fate regulator YaaT (PSP1 superfamily)
MMEDGSMADMPAQKEQTTHPDSHVIGIRFEKLGKLYHFDYSGYPDVQPQDYVVVETVRGVQIGQVMGFALREEEQWDYKPILRMANGRDLLLQQQWKDKQVETIIDCRELAAEIGGYAAVKFVEAEYNFDGSYLTVMYSTEEDVDVSRIREAMQERVGIDTEFRRIGPREVARRLGGQGACGIPRCCSTFLTDFSPISIKMAKAQNIPLNPSEITGMCGRLRCCLLYEYEQYVEARKQLPRRNKLIGTPFGEAKVADIHPLKDGVSVYIERTRYFIPREDIIPLDEFRALQEKAAQGCSKNETGGCDCGAHRPKNASADLKDAIEMAHGQTGVQEEEQTEDRSKRSRRNRHKRGKSNSRNRKSSGKSEQNSDSGGKSKSKRKRRRGRNKRRGNFKRNNDQD